MVRKGLRRVTGDKMPDDTGFGNRATPATIMGTWLALSIAFLLPEADLTSAFAVGLLLLSDTGGVVGAALVALVSASLLILRAPLRERRILREAPVHVLILAVALGGGALANESLIKPAFAAPRPSIVALAESNALGMSPKQFYASMSKQERRIHLQAILADPEVEAIALAPRIRDHWIHESGYSFPSGHALSAMLLATYFVMLGAKFATNTYRRLFYVLPVWAVLVGWSRVLLQAHHPEDILWGGALGVLLGAASGWLSTRLLWRAGASQPPSARGD